MPGREKTLQQERASYPAITSGTFQNGLWDDLTYFFFYTVFLRLLRITSPLACRGPSFFYSNSVSVLLSLILFSQACTAPPKWCKSILTRDQDPYDKQSLLLEAHQTHLNDRQKQKISAPCAFCRNPIENLLMPSPICATLTSLMLYFFFFFAVGMGWCVGGVYGREGLHHQGDLLAWSPVWDRNNIGPWIEQSLISFLSIIFLHLPSRTIQNQTNDK